MTRALTACPDARDTSPPQPQRDPPPTQPPPQHHAHGPPHRSTPASVDNGTVHLGLMALWLALLLPIPYVHVFMTCLVSCVQGFAQAICLGAWLLMRYIAMTTIKQGHGLLGHQGPSQGTSMPTCPLGAPTLLGLESHCLPWYMLEDPISS